MASQKEAQEQAAKIALFRSQMTRIVVQMEELFAAVTDSRTTAVITFGTAKLEQQLAISEMTVKRVLKEVQRASETGFVNGIPATFDDVRSLTLKLGKAVNDYTKKIDEWNNVFLTEQLAPLVTGVREAVSGIVAGVAGAVGFARYLPYVLVGGAVLLFVVPPLLRTIRAARRSGGEAALDTGIDELEATQQRVVSAGRSAGQLANRGAQLYLTKGMAGSSRRRIGR